MKRRCAVSPLWLRLFVTEVGMKPGVFPPGMFRHVDRNCCQHGPEKTLVSNKFQFSCFPTGLLGRGYWDKLSFLRAHDLPIPN